MGDDELSVSRHGDVEFEAVDACGDGIAKARQRVFGKDAAGAAVALTLEGCAGQARGVMFLFLGHGAVPVHKGRDA